MLDCPEHNQTSPNKMFLIMMSLICISEGSPAFCVGKITAQSPFLSAFVLYVSPRNFTITDSLGDAQPHTLTGVSL